MTFSHARAAGDRQRAPLQLDDRAAGLLEPAADELDRPGRPGDAVKVVAGQRLALVGPRRARRTARRRPAPSRPPAAHQASMLRWLWPCRTSSAPCRDSTASSSAASSRPRKRLGLARQRRMVDQHEAEDARPGRGARAPCRDGRAAPAPSRPEATSGGVGTAELTPMIATRPSMRTKGNARSRLGMRGALRARGHVGGPALRAGIAAQARIDVVVAGNDGHVLRRPQALEPGQRIDVLLRQADVDEIAGHGDVVGRLRREVGDDAVEHGPLVGLRGGCAASWRSRAARFRFQ